VAYALSIGTKIIDLGDLELLQVQIFSEFCDNWYVWEETTAKRM